MFKLRKTSIIVLGELSHKELVTGKNLFEGFRALRSRLTFWNIAVLTDDLRASFSRHSSDWDAIFFI